MSDIQANEGHIQQFSNPNLVKSQINSDGLPSWPGMIGQDKTRQDDMLSLHKNPVPLLCFGLLTNLW